jgi:hypothetical protein
MVDFLKFSRSSWRLKIERAKHHLRDLHQAVEQYTQRHPYSAWRIQQRDGEPDVWRYKLLFWPDVEPYLAMILGDVVHNLRSALDHLAVAIAPPDRAGDASFPIHTENIWTKDAGGAPLLKHKGARRSFKRAVKRMPDAAVAIIRKLQPCFSDQPEANHLAILNWLEQADKHRNLVPYALGLQDAVCTVLLGGASAMRQEFAFCEKDAVIAEFRLPDRLPLSQSQVQVEIRGTPKIAVDIGLPGQPADMLAIADRLVERVPYEVFSELEHFAR